MKVKREKFITFIYFALLPLIFGAAFALTIDWSDLQSNLIRPIFWVFGGLFALTFSRFFMCAYYFNAVEQYKSNIDTDKYVVLRSGGPGSGKSSSQVYTSVELAKKMWSKIVHDYLIYRGCVSDWRKAGNVDKLAEWAELKYAYKFYSKHADYMIPCLYSNITIRVDGRVSYKLTLDHFMQNKRLPAFAVLNNDDSGNSLPAELSTSTPPKLVSFFRYVRHFGEFHVLVNDQRNTNQIIGIRSVMSENIHMEKMTVCCQANMLLLLRRFLDKKVFSINVDSYAKHTKFCRFMRLLDSLINTIGFRRYNCSIQGNMDNDGIKTVSKRLVFYTPRGLNCEYASRSYMLCYGALNKEIDIPEYVESLLVKKADYEADNELVAELHTKKLDKRLSRTERRLLKNTTAKTAENTANTSQKLSFAKCWRLFDFNFPLSYRFHLSSAFGSFFNCDTVTFNNK